MSYCLTDAPVRHAGSAVAFGKLHGVLPSKPLSLPGKDMLNIGAAPTLTSWRHRMHHKACAAVQA